MGDVQVKRARKALNYLLAAMSFDDKENNHFKGAERTCLLVEEGIRVVLIKNELQGISCLCL